MGVALEPEGVVPPGMMTGMLPLSSPSVFSSIEIETDFRLQLLHEEQPADDDETGALLVVDFVVV